MTQEFVCNHALGVCKHNCRLITDIPPETQEEKEMRIDRSFEAIMIICYCSRNLTNSPYWMKVEDWERCRKEKEVKE